MALYASAYIPFETEEKISVGGIVIRTERIPYKACLIPVKPMGRFFLWEVSHLFGPGEDDYSIPAKPVFLAVPIPRTQEPTINTAVNQLNRVLTKVGTQVQKMLATVAETTQDNAWMVKVSPSGNGFSISLEEANAVAEELKGSLLFQTGVVDVARRNL